MNFLPLHPDDLDKNLHLFDHYIKDAIQFGEIDYEELLVSIREGHIIVNVVCEEIDDIYGVCLTRTEYFYGRHIFCLFCIGGREIKKWLDEGMEFLDNQAKLLECDRITAMGREGWEKMLKPYGYNKTHILLQKVLS